MNANTQGVSLLKRTDAGSDLPVEEKARNLAARLWEVTRELDSARAGLAERRGSEAALQA